MHRNNQNNDPRSYSYLPPLNSPSPRNTHYQYYDSRLPTQQSLYINTTSIVTYASPRFQQQYQPSTTISDLAEPISVFDDLEFPRHRQSNVIPFRPVYIPPTPSRRTSISDTRLTTASAVRERLLIDIQHNINEIDQELSSLGRRPSTPRYLLPRLSSTNKKTPLSNENKQIWTNKPKKIYEVIPRITSESQMTLRHSTAKLTDRTDSYSYIGQYHYGPEIEETEILDNDPENSALLSTADEMSRLSFHETFSLDQFRREQSDLIQNRALIFVPEYGNNNESGLNETTKDIHQNDPINVQSSQDFTSFDKLNIQDSELLIQTASEQTIEIPSSSTVNPDEFSDTIEADLTNTMLSNPTKHSPPSTATQERASPSHQAIINTKNNSPVDTAYFFSDFGNEADGEGDLISIDQSQFTLPIESEILADDSLSNTLIKQSQTLLLNPYSSQEQQQQLPIQNNNEHVKETESKTTDATTEHIIISTSTLPSKKIFPISIDDNMQTQFARNDSDVNEDQRQPSPENRPNNFSIEVHSYSSPYEQKDPLENMNSIPQRSASLRRSSQTQSSNILPRERSISSVDIRKTSAKQTEDILNNDELVESGRNSALPVPLNSPDLNDIRPSTSRSTTPERRNSIPSLDQNNLPTPTDLITFDNINTDHSQTNTERLPSISPLHCHRSDTNLTSVDPEDTYRQTLSPDDNSNQLKNPSSETIEEELPPITASQRRSKLSLIVRRPKPKPQKSINEQTHTIDSTSINNTKKAEQPRRVSFSNHISHFQVEEYNPLKHWRERIDNILSKKRFPIDKYSYVKSRVNSFANFDYQSRKIITAVPKTKLRTNDKKENKPKKHKIQPKQQIPLIKGPRPQLYGRLWCLTDGSPKVFHESLNWNAKSKVKAYSFENLHYKSRRNDTKKPRWRSEPQVSELVKDTPSRQILIQTISDVDELNFYQQESKTEKKIFDINSNGQQSSSKFQESLLSMASSTSIHSNRLIFDEKLVWTKKSKLKDLIWQNRNYQPKKSKVQIFHQPIHWNNQSKLHITHTLTLDIQAKVNYWSEIDLHQSTKNKALFSQYDNSEWNDIIPDNNYPLLSSTQNFLEENFNDQLREEVGNNVAMISLLTEAKEKE